MSSVQSLREFISERLTAAAEEIFTEFEKTIVQFEEVIDRQRRLLETSWRPHVQYEEELDRQRRLLETSWRPHMDLHTAELPQQHVWKEDENPTDQRLCNQESNSSLDQEEPEPPQKEPESLEMKEEQETDAFLVTPAFNKIYNWELEPNRNQLLSQNSAEAENQVQEGSRTVDPGSCRDEELRHNKRSPQARGHSDNVDRPKVKGEQKKPFLCTTCGKRFRVKYGFTAHMRTHTGERPFSCQTCGKKFIRRSALNSHMKTHTGEKPFSCSTCGKCFHQKCLLTNHTKIHTGDRPFSCQICGKKCIRKTDLISHMRIHTGEKPFSCQICGNKFNQKSNLIRHTRTHTDEKRCLISEWGEKICSKDSIQSDT